MSYLLWERLFFIGMGLAAGLLVGYIIGLNQVKKEKQDGL